MKSIPPRRYRTQLGIRERALLCALPGPTGKQIKFPDLNIAARDDKILQGTFGLRPVCSSRQRLPDLYREVRIHVQFTSYLRYALILQFDLFSYHNGYATLLHVTLHLLTVASQHCRACEGGWSILFRPYLVNYRPASMVNFSPAVTILNLIYSSILYVVLFLFISIDPQAIAFPVFVL